MELIPVNVGEPGVSCDVSCYDVKTDAVTVSDLIQRIMVASGPVGRGRGTVYVGHDARPSIYVCDYDGSGVCCFAAVGYEESLAAEIVSVRLEDSWGRADYRVKVKASCKLIDSPGKKYSKRRLRRELFYTLRDALDAAGNYALKNEGLVVGAQVELDPLRAKLNSLENGFDHVDRRFREKVGPVKGEFDAVRVVDKNSLEDIAYFCYWTDVIE